MDIGWDEAGELPWWQYRAWTRLLLEEFTAGSEDPYVEPVAEQLVEDATTNDLTALGFDIG